MECYRINEPQVIQETFDDEVVIVNLETGNYYSLDQVGSSVWELIKQGASHEDIIDLISRQFEGDAAFIKDSINQLLSEMEKESLIVLSSAGKPSFKTEMNGESPRARFQRPILEKYTDMQELLLLDPIHEVDEAGWPSVKQNHSNE
jgi:hypothetical protein